MTADVPTLLLMVILSSVVMAGALLVLGGWQPKDGLPYWAGALMLGAAGYTLFLLRGRVSDLWSIVLANALLAAMSKVTAVGRTAVGEVVLSGTNGRLIAVK